MVMFIYEDLLEFYMGDTTNCTKGAQFFRLDVKEMKLCVNKDSHRLNFLTDSIKLDSCFSHMSELKYTSSRWENTTSLDSTNYKFWFYAILNSKDTTKYKNQKNYFYIGFTVRQNKIIKTEPLFLCK